MPTWRRIAGTVVEGHRVASGAAKDSPYPKSSIEMQTPFFLERGLDLRPFFAGTIGVSCTPVEFDITKPEFTFRDVKWSPDHHSEDFSFSRCRIVFEGVAYDGWVYYPHPETKLGHFHDRSTLEVLAPYIPGIRYGVDVGLDINPDEVEIVED